MLVLLPDGARLDFFLRYPGSRFWNQAHAVDFLTQHCRPSSALEALRPLFERRSRSEDFLSVSGMHLLQRVALLITTGRIAPVQPKVGERVPGTGVMLRAPAGSVLLLWHNRLNPARYLSPALGWLQHVEHDSGDLVRLRKMLLDSCRSLILHDERHPEFVERVAELLRSGELIAVWHPPQGINEDTVELESSRPHHAFPTRRNAASEIDETIVREAATFPSNIDAVLIARIKREAARLGIPFCEECLKRAMAGAQ